MKKMLQDVMKFLIFSFLLDVCHSRGLSVYYLPSLGSSEMFRKKITNDVISVSIIFMENVKCLIK